MSSTVVCVAVQHIEDIRIEVCNVLTTVSFLENTIIGRQGLRSKTVRLPL